MAQVKWTVDYGSYKAGQKCEVDDLSKVKKHLESGRMEVVKAKPETAITPQAETATLKKEPGKKAKKPKK